MASYFEVPLSVIDQKVWDEIQLSVCRQDQLCAFCCYLFAEGKLPSPGDLYRAFDGGTLLILETGEVFHSISKDRIRFTVPTIAPIPVFAVVEL